MAVPFTPGTWPATVVLDELGFDARGGGRDVLFQILAAFGSDVGARQEVLALRAGPSKSGGLVGGGAPLAAGSVGADRL